MICGYKWGCVLWFIPRRVATGKWFSLPTLSLLVLQPLYKLGGRPKLKVTPYLRPLTS